MSNTDKAEMIQYVWPPEHLSNMGLIFGGELILNTLFFSTYIHSGSEDTFEKARKFVDGFPSVQGMPCQGGQASQPGRLRHAGPFSCVIHISA